MKGDGEAHIRADPPLIVPIRNLVDRAGARRLELAARMLLDPYLARLSGDAAECWSAIGTPTWRARSSAWAARPMTALTGECTATLYPRFSAF